MPFFALHFCQPLRIFCLQNKPVPAWLASSASLGDFVHPPPHSGSSWLLSTLAHEGSLENRKICSCFPTSFQASLSICPSDHLRTLDFLVSYDHFLYLIRFVKVDFCDTWTPSKTSPKTLDQPMIKFSLHPSRSPRCLLCACSDSSFLRRTRRSGWFTWNSS